MYKNTGIRVNAQENLRIWERHITLYQWQTYLACAGALISPRTTPASQLEQLHMPTLSCSHLAHPPSGSFHHLCSQSLSQRHRLSAQGANWQKQGDTKADKLSYLEWSHTDTNTHTSPTLIFRAGRIYEWFILNLSLGFFLQDWASTEPDHSTHFLCQQFMNPPP